MSLIKKGKRLEKAEERRASKPVIEPEPIKVGPPGPTEIPKKTKKAVKKPKTKKKSKK